MELLRNGNHCLVLGVSQFLFMNDKGEWLMFGVASLIVYFSCYGALANWYKDVPYLFVLNTIEWVNDKD